MIGVIILAAIYVVGTTTYCIANSVWKGEENFMSSLPEDQKPGNIKVVDNPPTTIDKGFMYAQDWLSRTLFGKGVE